jgi:hypothetical protein
MRPSAAFTWCESTIPKQLKALGMSCVYYRNTLVALLKELHYSLLLAQSLGDYFNEEVVAVDLRQCWRVTGTSAHRSKCDQL